MFESVWKVSEEHVWSSLQLRVLTVEGDGHSSLQACLITPARVSQLLHNERRDTHGQAHRTIVGIHSIQVEGVANVVSGHKSERGVGGSGWL